MVRVCAVLGDPIEHSLSPVLHRAAYAAAGLDWSYHREQVDESRLERFLSDLTPEWRGLSLTMPLKRAVLRLVDRVSDTARRAGAANTVVLEDDGTRSADNTDVPGAVAAVRERYAGPIRTVTILGGGATATSVGMALASLGAEQVVLAVRSPERAAETVAVLSALEAAPEVSVVPLGATELRGEVLVSTVPAVAQTPALVARSLDVPVVFEVLYHPWPTPLATAVGPDRALVGGLDLLVHQAGLQFTQFTGLPAPVSVMRAAGEWALAHR